MYLQCLLNHFMDKSFLEDAYKNIVAMGSAVWPNRLLRNSRYCHFQQTALTKFFVTLKLTCDGILSCAIQCSWSAKITSSFTAYIVINTVKLNQPQMCTNLQLFLCASKQVCSLCVHVCFVVGMCTDPVNLGFSDPRTCIHMAAINYLIVRLMALLSYLFDLCICFLCSGPILTIN